MQKGNPSVSCFRLGFCRRTERPHRHSSLSQAFAASILISLLRPVHSIDPSVLMSFADKNESDSDIPPFTPSHRLQNRFQTFTKFLFTNLRELSEPLPPLPPPPLLTFACTDRRVKGRIPHRTAAISALLPLEFDDLQPDASKVEDVFDDVKANEDAGVGGISVKMDICKVAAVNEVHRGMRCVQMDLGHCNGNICGGRPCIPTDHDNTPAEIDNLLDEVCIEIDTGKDSALSCGQMDVDHNSGNITGEKSQIKLDVDTSLETHEGDEIQENTCLLPCDKIVLPCYQTNGSIEGVTVDTCEEIEQNKIEIDNDLEEGELSEKWIDNESMNSVQEANSVEEIETQEKVAPGNSLEQFHFEEGGTSTEFLVSRYFAHNFANDCYAQELNDRPQSVDISTRQKKKKKSKKKRTIIQKKQHEITGATALKVRGVVELFKERSEKAVNINTVVSDKNEAFKMKKEKRNTSVLLLDKPEEATRNGIQQNKQCPLPESMKGILSKAVEEEVGLWTSDVQDSQHLSTEAKHVDMKPKRTLTAARKKKRQIAKHRKAAQKEEALGIRRLRFKPLTIKKEREIKFCQFYVKGKCTKGTECTFSHNITPLTKAEMCKYFINNCCLKGEECPFSHALSTFPCKFFHTRGYCLDADSCRFSHKPITEEQRQELQRKVEKEQQVRQGNLTATDKKLSSMDVNLKRTDGDTPLFDPSSFIPEFSSMHTEENQEIYDHSDADALKEAENPKMPSLDTDADITLRCGGDSTISEDAKERAMKILQASLEANQHVSKRKATTMVCDIRMSNPLSESPVAQTMFGMPTPKDPKSKAMEILQSSFRSSELMSGMESSAKAQCSPLTAIGKNERSGESSGSKTHASESPSAASILLDKFLKPQEVPKPSGPSIKRTTVDSLLSKILNG